MKTSPCQSRVERNRSAMTCVTFAALAIIGLQNARAQYPRVPPEVQAEANARRVAADQRSDAAWEKALPTIKAWEGKGQPSIPWAAKPAELPQAKIPSFPGTSLGSIPVSFLIAAARPAARGR